MNLHIKTTAIFFIDESDIIGTLVTSASEHVIPNKNFINHDMNNLQIEIV